MDLASLYESHRHSLFRYLVRLAGDEPLAEDIVQETFLRFVRRPPPRTDNVRAWLFTVASNIARDGIRERARHRRLLAASPDRLPLGDTLPNPEQLAEQADTRRRVHEMLETLSEKERMVLLMREEGFTHSEIAEVVNTTTKSIGTVIARALRKLARRFGHSREIVT